MNQNQANKGRNLRKRVGKGVATFMLIVCTIILTGCGPYTGGDSPSKKYYTGYDSLEMTFADQSPPSIVYYDPDPSAENEIPIIVEVKNKGSSDSYGALYVHGYDPNIMEVAGGADWMPRAGTASFSGGRSSNGVTMLSFNIEGVYLGLASGHGRTSATAGFNHNGKTYGTSVFTEDGKLRGLSVNIGPENRRIGLRTVTLGMLSQFFGYNAVIALEGDTKDTPGGGVEVYDFPVYIYYLPSSVDEFRQRVMVTACYDYVTQATAMVCLDSKPQSSVKKSCRTQAVSMGGGQGAPVAVTRVEPQATSTKVAFVIQVQHSKKGTYDEVYDYNSLYKCNPESGEIVKQSDKNIVYVGYIALSGYDITGYCTPTNMIRLDTSGKGEIRCVAPICNMATGCPPGAIPASENAYQAPLEIELWYGYTKSIYKDVIVKRI